MKKKISSIYIDDYGVNLAKNVTVVRRLSWGKGKPIRMKYTDVSPSTMARLARLSRRHDLYTHVRELEIVCKPAPHSVMITRKENE